MDQPGTLLGALTAIAVTLGLFAQIVLQIMARKKVAEVAVQAKVAASEVEKVKQTLLTSGKVTSNKLDSLARATEVVRTLVNHGFGVLLREKWELLEEKAIRTMTDVDREAADLAGKAYTDHQAKQAEVDAQETTTPGRAPGPAGQNQASQF